VRHGCAGVDARKIRVVPEGVNTSHFNPKSYQPLDLASMGELVFGQHSKRFGKEKAAGQPTRDGVVEEPFVFISSFKW